MTDPYQRPRNHSADFGTAKLCLRCNNRIEVGEVLAYRMGICKEHVPSNRINKYAHVPRRCRELGDHCRVCGKDTLLGDTLCEQDRQYFPAIHFSQEWIPTVEPRNKRDWYNWLALLSNAPTIVARFELFNHLEQTEDYCELAHFVIRYRDALGNCDGIPFEYRSLANRFRIHDYLCRNRFNMPRRLVTYLINTEAMRDTLDILVFDPGHHSLSWKSRRIGQGPGRLVVMRRSDDMERVVIGIPGMGSSLAGFRTVDAPLLKLHRMLQRSGWSEPPTLITWLGYTSPGWRLLLHPSISLALDGARNLNSFLEAVWAEQGGKDEFPRPTRSSEGSAKPNSVSGTLLGNVSRSGTQRVLLGFSYGSVVAALTASLSVQRPWAISGMVLAGCPGVPFQAPAQVGLEAKNIIAIANEADIIATGSLGYSLYKADLSVRLPTQPRSRLRRVGDIVRKLARHEHPANETRFQKSRAQWLELTGDLRNQLSGAPGLFQMGVAINLLMSPVDLEEAVNDDHNGIFVRHRMTWYLRVLERLFRPLREKNLAIADQWRMEISEGSRATSRVGRST